MTTVAELAARDHVEIGYLFVLQGCPFMFTDRAELAGEGVFSWLGIAYGPRRVLEGLDLQGATITYATETGDGRPDTDDGLTVKIVDFARELIAFFAEQPDAIPVGGRLGPKDDPAPTDLIGTSGDNVPIWGQWVNAEAIGPAGERSYYSLLPGGDGFGQDHAAYSGDITSLAASYVYATPTHLEGRRVALYRIYKDLDSGTWPAWQDQYDSGVSLIWVGSLTNEIEVRDIEWSLKCEGPSSWLRKQLGTNRPNEWQRVSGSATLDDTPGAREDLFALDFVYQQISDSSVEVGGSSYFTASDVLPLAGDSKVFRDAINLRINVVSALTVGAFTWTTDRGAEAQIEFDYVTVRVDDTPGGGFIKAAIWRLGAHEKVWRAMGYDPYAQSATNYDTAFEIKFVAGEDSAMPGLPGPGYWVGTFWTAPIGYDSLVAAGAYADNDGKTRAYQAIAPPDIAQILPTANFEISLGVGSPAYFEGQTNRAPAEHTLSLSAGDCDTQGYIALRGSYLENTIGAEVQTMAQLAQICWHTDSVVVGGDTIGLDSDQAARVYVSKLIDPRFHGVDRKPLSRIWASADLEYCPVNFFGYAFNSGDYAHRMLLRLFLSTGTASWSGFEGAATLTPGANHPTALDGLEPYSDAEIADLGLGIPYSLIDINSFASAAASLPDGITSPLNRCRYAWIGAQDSQELIAAVLEPRGWGLGFNQGQWRMFCRPDVLTAADVEVTISAADIVGEPSFIENANLRPFTPRERWKVDSSRALVEEAATEDRDLTVEARALDRSSRSRRDNGVADVQGWGLVPIPLWQNENPPNESDWVQVWRQHFAQAMAQWCNAGHVMIKGLPVLPSIARQVGPGSVVRFSSYYAATREGTYGPTAKLGRVFKVEHDLDSREAKIDVLLQPGDALAARLFAPIAALVDNVTTVEERHDVASRTFFCKADAFTVGGGQHDVTFFDEPAWLGVGGDALVEGWQWNGREWSQTFGFTVESVSAVTDSIVYQVGTLTGVWHESRYTILVLAPWDDQAANSWPRSLFSVLTRFDFKFGAVPTQGYPLA
jgi:hypothetical protein